MTKNRIRELREARGWTLEHLAELVGVSHATVQRWETDKRTPRAERLRELARLFDRPIDDLLHPETNGHGSHSQRQGRSTDINRLESSRNNPNDLSQKLGGDPVQNSQLILRAIRNMGKDLSEVRELLATRMENMAKHVQELGDAIELAEGIEKRVQTTHEERPRPRLRSRKK